MKRPGHIKAGALCHTTAGSARRRHQDDLAVRVQPAVYLQDRFQNRRFAGTGRACDNGKIVAIRRIDGSLLFGGQHHAHLTLDPFQHPLNPLRF